MINLKAVAIPEFFTKEVYGEINCAMSMPFTFVKSVFSAAAVIVWQINKSDDSVITMFLILSSVVVLSFGVMIFTYKKKN